MKMFCHPKSRPSPWLHGPWKWFIQKGNTGCLQNNRKYTSQYWLRHAILLAGFLPVLLLARTGSMHFELLIIEVEKRPAIWDPRDPKHCHRELGPVHTRADPYGPDPKLVRIGLPCTLAPTYWHQFGSAICTRYR